MLTAIETVFEVTRELPLLEKIDIRGKRWRKDEAGRHFESLHLGLER